MNTSGCFADGLRHGDRPWPRSAGGGAGRFVRTSWSVCVIKHQTGLGRPRLSVWRSGLVTDRLILRSWRLEDAQAALDVYGNSEVARWLSPVMDRVPDLAAMRLANWTFSQDISEIFAVVRPGNTRAGAKRPPQRYGMGR